MAFTIRTNQELEDALDQLAEIEGLSRQEIVRRAVLERLHQTIHADRVEEAIERLSQRWGDVLDRLGRE